MSPEAFTAGVTGAEPGVTNGITLSAAFGFFNVAAGLMIAAAFILFFGGLIGWATRLGLESRLEGLKYMYRGTTILFVLVLILTVINFIQFHTKTVYWILGVAVVILIIWMAIQVSQSAGEEDER